jgi:hypothetical protein
MAKKKMGYVTQINIPQCLAKQVKIISILWICIICNKTHGDHKSNRMFFQNEKNLLSKKKKLT